MIGEHWFSELHKPIKSIALTQITIVRVNKLVVDFKIQERKQDQHEEIVKLYRKVTDEYKEDSNKIQTTRRFNLFQFCDKICA